MRRGITLMEVLIAMFVLLIGLLGVFSMLPVAKSYMADGVKYDAVSTLGHKALHDLEVRKELMDPSNWFAPMANGQFMEVCPAAQKIPLMGGNSFAGSYNYAWSNFSAIQTIPAAPFVLDPLGCAYPDNLAQNGGTGAVSPGGQINVAGSFGPMFFPPSAFSLDGAGSPGSPAITRVTVPRTGSVMTNASGIRFCSPIQFGMASKIFQSSDDVLFNRTDDPTQRPFASLPTAAAPTQFSTSQGDYSWFAVIDNMQRPWNPGTDGGWGQSHNPPIPADDDNGDGVINDIGEAGWPVTDDIALWQTSGGELWHISVVTVHKRNLQLTPTTPTDIPPERMCYCDFLGTPTSVNPATPQGKAVFDNAGLGGNDVVLFVPNSLAPSPDWLNVKPNQWVMMSAWPNLNSPTAGGITNPVRAQLAMVQWFRISSAGEVSRMLDSSGNMIGWQRPVTLAGRDWNPYKFVDAVGAPLGNQSCYCTIVDGAVGVFEATIEQGE